MNSSVQGQPTSRLVIRRIRFNSPIAFRLVSALDVEQELLHPGWETFPYAGPGNWLVGDPDTNVPVADAESDKSHQPTHDADSEVYTFAAFICPSKHETQLDNNRPPGDDDAIGCIGVKVISDHFSTNDELQSTQPGRVLHGPSKESAGPRTAQLKRLYVEPAYRGRPKNLDLDCSVAQTLLNYVETFAQEELYVKRLILETGMNQTPALKLYGRCGWTRCADFGEFIGAGEDVGGLSRCFEKWLL